MRLTGWTLEQIDDAPAVTLDWMLACDRATAEAVNRRADEERSRMETS